eukprot:7373342-Alexandrium_andersonii.AAC.1
MLFKFRALGYPHQVLSKSLWSPPELSPILSAPSRALHRALLIAEDLSRAVWTPLEPLRALQSLPDPSTAIHGALFIVEDLPRAVWNSPELVGSIKSPPPSSLDSRRPLS